jgi:hypothetical protein
MGHRETSKTSPSQRIGEMNMPLIGTSAEQAQEPQITPPHTSALHEPPMQALTMDTLLIFQAPPTYPLAERYTALISASVARMVRKVGGYLEYRRYPRSLAYMQQLVERVLPGFQAEKAQLVTSQQELERVPWSQFSTVVVLWPDANGAGWTSVETHVFSKKMPGCRVYVLNGRGRLFDLNRRLWRSYQFKRVLEKSFVLETLVLGIFLVTSPVMALWDLVTKGDK